MWGSSMQVEIPKQPTVIFPKLCPRCLKLAEREIEVRRVSYGWGLMHVKKIKVPICNDCYQEIAPKHFVISFILGWGLVALGLFLVSKISGTWRIVSFFLCLIASRVAKDYNPFGVEFYEGKKTYVWIFPQPEYAKLFAQANGGKIVLHVRRSHDLSKPSQ